MAYRAPTLRPQLAASPASRVPLSDSRRPLVYSGSNGFWSGRGRSGRASTSSSRVEDKVLRRRGLDGDQTSVRAFSSPREGANWMGSSPASSSSSSSSHASSSSESWIRDKLSGVRPSSLAGRAPATGTKRQCSSPPPSADRSEKKAKEDLAMEEPPEALAMEEQQDALATKEQALAMEEEQGAPATKGEQEVLPEMEEEQLVMEEEQESLAIDKMESGMEEQPGIEEEVLPEMEEQLMIEEEQELSAMDKMESGMEEQPGIEEEQPATEEVPAMETPVLEKESVPYFAGPSFNFAPHPSELPFPSLLIHLIHSH
uniref:Uncharacterized protein n=1 Tax=Oryza nivara TaxID=4536 RepID=A0A0E0FS44_ORYNI